jgi:uncharacterized protein (DUF1778 family)
LPYSLQDQTSVNMHTPVKTIKNTTKSPLVKKAPKARLEARISIDVHNKIKRAAQLQGRTITDFVIAAAQDAAQHAIEQAELVRLSLDDQEIFANALINPHEPATALDRAFERRAALLRTE